MQKSYAVKRYSYTSFDKYLCLKPPALLWLVTIFLARAILLPLVVVLSSFKSGGNADTQHLVTELVGPASILPTLPAFLVFYALIRRTPGASRTVRWIWAHGRWLLSGAALLDIAIVLLDPPLMTGKIAVAIFDLYCLAYVLGARHVRDAFSDFPSPAEQPS